MRLNNFVRCTALVLALSVLPSWACTDRDGAPIPSIFELPTFEDTPVAVQATYNASISTATTSLSEVLSLDPALSTFSANEEELPLLLTYENTIGALSRLLRGVWEPGYRLYLLSQTSDQEEMRNSALQAVVGMEKWARDNIDFNRDLYKVIAAFAETDEAAGLSGERLQLFNGTLAGYERRGMALSANDRAQVTSWEDRLSELTTNITTNINNDEGAVDFVLQELAGLTEQQLAALQYNANTTMYTALTAIRAHYGIVAGYADDSNTRLKAVRARLTRVMEENGDLILEVVQLRQKIAALLGFDH